MTPKIHRRFTNNAIAVLASRSFVVGPKPDDKAADGHRSVGLYVLDENRERFMGTVGVPARYALPKDGRIVEVRYLYCHPGPEGNDPIQLMN